MKTKVLILAFSIAMASSCSDDPTRLMCVDGYIGIGRVQDSSNGEGLPDVLILRLDRGPEGQVNWYYIDRTDESGVFDFSGFPETQPNRDMVLKFEKQGYKTRELNVSESAVREAGRWRLYVDLATEVSNTSPNKRIQLTSASVTRAAGHPARRPAEDGGRGRS